MKQFVQAQDQDSEALQHLKKFFPKLSEHAHLDQFNDNMGAYSE